MSKHLHNLQRLCQKMQVRYGECDVLVLELKQEIASHEAKKSRHAAAVNPLRRKDDQSALSQLLH